MTSTQTVQRYIDAWNATDPADRRAAVRATFTEHVHYRDPLSEVSGHDGVEALIAGAHEQFPGMGFRLLGEADGHHDVVRFAWTLGPDGAEPPIVGFDVVRVAVDGRIVDVAGFLDRVPTG